MKLEEALLDSKEIILEKVKKSFKELLPEACDEDVKEAIEIVYEDGITYSELRKKVYSFLYPVRDPSLW